MVEETARNVPLAVTVLVVIVFVTLATGIAWVVGQSFQFAWQSEEDRQITNMERFPWASPECVAQEVVNPGYENAEDRIRLCQLEMQLEDLRLQLEAVGVSRETGASE